MITGDRLRELLDYDPDTGIFQWKVRSAQRIKVGDVAGSSDPRGYVRIRVDGNHYWAHRLAWLWMMDEWSKKSDVDHINGIKSDNRWDNLRDATRAENMWNVGPNTSNSSGAKGVSFDKASGRFVANIEHINRRFWLGSFSNAEEAAAMFEGAAKLIRGEFHHAN